MRLGKAARVILVGAPGVGKGTQSERLLKRFPELSSVSSGDLLRTNVRNRTAIGVEAQKIMKAGALVPDAMIIQLITNELKSRGWVRQRDSQPYTLNFSATPLSSENITDDTAGLFGQSLETSESPSASFILDGFPRTASQASQLDALIPMNLVVHIHTPASIIIDRIADRWIHEPSGRVYNTTFNPPKIEGKDDVTGESLTRREDDSPDTVRARLGQFEKNARPLLDHYERLGVLWRVQGNSSDEISPKLFDEVGRRFGSAIA